MKQVQAPLCQLPKDALCFTLLRLPPALGSEPLCSGSLHHWTVLISARKALNLPLPLTWREKTEEKHRLKWKRHTLAILPAVSCTLLKAEVMFIPGLFTGATTWIETGMRTQETLPRGSPRAVLHLLSLTVSHHWQNVEFLYCFQCKPFKTFIWGSQTPSAGVSKPPSFSNTVWQTCPRTREGNREETQEQSVTVATCSLGHLQQLSAAKNIYSCNFWMLREKSLSRKKLMSVYLLPWGLFFAVLWPLWMGLGSVTEERRGGYLSFSSIDTCLWLYVGQSVLGLWGLQLEAHFGAGTL